MMSFLVNLKDVGSAMRKLAELEPVLEFVCNCLGTTNVLLQELSLNVLNGMLFVSKAFFLVLVEGIAKYVFPL